MKRLIEYRYTSWVEGCGCCSYSDTSYDMWEDGKLVRDEWPVELCENEGELREALKELEPFEVSEGSVWF